MTRKLANKNKKKKENRSKEIKPEFTHSAIFFFINQKKTSQGEPQQQKHCHDPTTGAVRPALEPQKNSSSTTAYYKTTSPKLEQKEVFKNRKVRKQLTDA